MRPTPRGWLLAGAAALLYFFANQTQVGWLYVLSALAAGIWLAALPLPRRLLRGLTVTRRINGTALPGDLELYARQPAVLDLEFSNLARIPALQVRGTETCPFAPPADRSLPFFVPLVPAHGKAELHFQTRCTRRGWHDLLPITLSTGAPFGFFSARRTVGDPAGVLVLPEYREIEHLPVLDRVPAAENTLTAIGVGSEVVGVREYRPGDSRRHIHWRSSARAGQLIVKEFAQETQPGLTLALDLRGSSAIGNSEDNTLELACKLAATLARYAVRRGLPVTLAANSQEWPAPPGPVSWWALMNYLARIQAGGDESFAECLQGLAIGAGSTFVTAILTIPDPAVVAPLVELRHTGPGALAVIVDPVPFLPPGQEPPVEARSLAGTLQTAGVNACVVGAGPDWEHTLMTDVA